jgi:hypothetical protein
MLQEFGGFVVVLASRVIAVVPSLSFQGLLIMQLNE